MSKETYIGFGGDDGGQGWSSSALTKLPASMSRAADASVEAEATTRVKPRLRLALSRSAFGEAGPCLGPRPAQRSILVQFCLPMARRSNRTLARLMSASVLARHGLAQCDAGIGLLQVGLVETGINLEEQVALLDGRPPP